METTPNHPWVDSSRLSILTDCLSQTWSAQEHRPKDELKNIAQSLPFPTFYYFLLMTCHKHFTHRSSSALHTRIQYCLQQASHFFRHHYRNSHSTNTSGQKRPIDNSTTLREQVGGLARFSNFPKHTALTWYYDRRLSASTKTACATLSHKPPSLIKALARQCAMSTGTHVRFRQQPSYRISDGMAIVTKHNRRCQSQSSPQILA